MKHDGDYVCDNFFVLFVFFLGKFKICDVGDFFLFLFRVVFDSNFLIKHNIEIKSRV